jgi:beta-alanine--pyruvate transaminase
MFRTVADSIAVTPPLIVSEAQIGEIFDKVAKVIRAVN